MRYAIFSDVHSNIEALRAVIRDCEVQGVRQYFCVGDILGYGASPVECIKALNEIKAQVVCGNHDLAIAGMISYDHFKDFAQESVKWTKNNISSDELKFISHLDYVYKNNDFIMVHSTLNTPENFIYMNDISLANDTFYLMDRPVCFIGHTHRTNILQKQGDTVSIVDKSTIEIDEKNKYIVNVGSVGQPRDGSPEASYCIFDPDLKRIEIKRVDYDVASAKAKILGAGLPDVLATRLLAGQ